MGFMDDYGLDATQIQAPGRAIAKEGRYLFEIGDAVVRKGTKNKPKDVFLLITYQLTDADDNPAPAAEERFWMKRDGRYDDTCKQSMGYLNFFLQRAGFEGVSDPEFTPDALVGLRGKLRIEQNKVGDRTYANAKEVEFLERDDDEDNSFAAEPAKAEPKKRAAKEPVTSPAADSPWEE
jgi:hypothetical protein